MERKPTTNSTTTDEEKSFTLPDKSTDSQEEDDSESDEESEEEEENQEFEEEEDEDPDESILIGGLCYSNDELLNLRLYKDKELKITNKLLNKIRRYLKSVEESHGFDLDPADWPGKIPGITTVVPKQWIIDDRHTHPEAYRFIMYLADKAIKDYNQTQHTSFKVDCVDKVNSTMVQGYTYWITFTASDPNSIDKATFQAKVWDNIPGRVKEVIFCNLKQL